MKIIISTDWLRRLDTWGHRLRVPMFILRPICDAYDERLLSAAIDQWPWETYLYFSGHPVTTSTSMTGSDYKVTFKTNG